MIYKKELLTLYYEMLRIRKVEEKISEKYSEQEMRCPIHLSIGQEAVAVGVSNNLKKKDKVLSTHRAHAHYLAKKGNLKKMIAELYGKITGCAQGKGGSMHLIDKINGFVAAVPIVASTIPISVGLSWSLKLKNKNNIVCVYFGEGATEEGVFFESLDFSILKELPMLFVCENNKYSVYTDISERQSNLRNITKLVRAHGIKSFSCDGNDVIKINQLVKNSINYIKNNKKPVFIEFYTYRWLEHCGPNWDDNLGYRPRGELNRWMKKDPIKKLERILNKKKYLNNKIINNMTIKIDKEINDAFNYAKKSKFPNKNNLFKHLYKQ